MSKYILFLSLLILSCVPSHIPERVKVSGSRDSVQTQIYWIKRDFAVYKKEIAKYPETYKAFQAALQKWADTLPITVTVTEMNDDTGLPQYATVIRFADLWNDIEFQLPMGILGIWQAPQHRILLNGAFLEARPIVAKRTSLHELGHVFGLPHITNAKHPSYSGYIILPDDVEASDYLMFPMCDSKEVDISPLEIKIALERFQYVELCDYMSLESYRQDEH